ncbi:MAG: HNH endonuclease [bacterium]
MKSSVGEIPKQIDHNGRVHHFHRPCLNWLGARDNTGYGVIRVPKGFMGSKAGIVRTHRLSAFLKNKFPINCQVDHICRNRLCIEPSHLEILGPKTHGKVSKKDQNNKDKNSANS